MQRTLTILNHAFYPDLPGGVEWCMWHMARALAEEGVAVRVLTERREGLAAEERISSNLIIERFAPMRAGPLTHRHDVRQMQRIHWWAGVLRKARSGGPLGPLWCNGYPMTTLGAVLAGRRRDVIFNPSTCVGATNRFARVYADQAGGGLSWWFEQLDRLAYRLAPRVVVSSNNLRDQLNDHYGQRPRNDVRVVPFGIAPGTPGTPGTPGAMPSPTSWDNRQALRRTARKRLGLPADAWVVGFVGRLDYCKDLPFLFQGIGRCQASFKHNLQVLVVGDGGLRAKLQDLAKTLGIADRVHWTGTLTDPAPAYEAMDVLAVPSVYETFGYVILEAMAAGLPVIGRGRDARSTRPVLTTNDELIRDGVDGVLVSPHDPANLAVKLQWIAAEPGRGRIMSEQAAKRAAARSWRDYVADLLPVLDSACDVRGVATRQPLRSEAA